MNKYEIKYLLESQTSILDRLSDTTGKQSFHIQEQRPIYTSVAIKRELYDDINELSTKVIRGTKLTIPQTINLLVRDGLTRHKLNKNKDLIFNYENGRTGK